MKLILFTLLALTAAPLTHAAITCNTKNAKPLSQVLPPATSEGSSSGGSYSGGSYSGGGGGSNDFNFNSLQGACLVASSTGATPSNCEKTTTNVYYRKDKRAASSFSCANSMTCISLDNGMLGCVNLTTGLWTDYTRSSALGATFTTSSSHANNIIAILSVLVAFTGSHLWDLIAFVLYCRGVTNGKKILIHHQFQLLARNITSPGSFLLELGKVSAARHLRGISAPLLAAAMLALICNGGFLVISVFISQIVSTSGLQVLVKSETCGWLSWRNESSNAHRLYQQLVMDQAYAYRETCYNKTAPTVQCNIYARQTIPIESKTHTACPFSGMCTNHSAIRLDTGLLDSNDVFGINTVPKARVQFQRVLTCAPIAGDKYFKAEPMPPDYVKKYFNRDPLPEEFLFQWFFGPPASPVEPYNSTVWHSNYTAKFRISQDLSPRAYYVTTDNSSIRNWHSSTFAPISELRRADADTQFMTFHSNGVRFYGPNDDPIFAAHKERNVTFDAGDPITMYTPDHPATFLACAEQFRFCLSGRGCTELSGAILSYTHARSLKPSYEQQAILEYLFLLTPTFYGVTRAPLLATRNEHSFQVGLPSNQWEVEIEAWLQFLLSLTQTAITHVAAGPGIVRADFDGLAENVSWPGICKSQRMGAPDGYSNVSMFWLLFVVVTSSIIIITNLGLVPTFKLLYRLGWMKSPRIQSWIQDGMLQIQRKAYETGETEHGDWKHYERDVPLLIDDARHLTPLSAQISSSHPANISQSVQNTASNTRPPSQVLQHNSTTNLNRIQSITSQSSTRRSSPALQSISQSSPQSASQPAASSTVQNEASAVPAAVNHNSMGLQTIAHITTTILTVSRRSTT